MKDIWQRQDNSLAELTKKIDIIELSENEKTNRHTRNIICHKCKEYGHTKKKCCRHNKIAKKINKLDFEKYIINKQMEIFNVNKKERSSWQKERTKIN